MGLESGKANAARLILTLWRAVNAGQFNYSWPRSRLSFVKIPPLENERADLLHTEDAELRRRGFRAGKRIASALERYCVGSTTRPAAHLVPTSTSVPRLLLIMPPVTGSGLGTSNSPSA